MGVAAPRTRIHRKPCGCGQHDGCRCHREVGQASPSTPSARTQSRPTLPGPGDGVDLMRVAARVTSTVPATVSRPGDALEREADQMAARAMAMPDPPGPAAASLRGWQARFGVRFGRDFSDVTVHTDAVAAATAHEVHADAFTVGRDIAFGAGQFAPDSHQGRRLLAHELAHVVQQAAPGRAPVLARQARPGSARVRGVRRASGGLPGEDRIVPIRPPANENATVRTHETEPGRTPAERARPKRTWRPAVEIEPRFAYADRGADTDWAAAAAFSARQRQAALLVYNLESWPLAVLNRGGSPPDFVTVAAAPTTYKLTAGDRLLYDELRGERISFTPRWFHVPNAIEHDLGLAKTPDEAWGVLLGYLPEMNPQQLRRDLSGGLPRTFIAPDGRLHHPRMPDGTAIGRVFPVGVPDFAGVPISARLDVFGDALRKSVLAERQRAKAAVLAEAEESALRGRGRRQGPCDSRRTAAIGGDRRHNRYAAHVASANGYAPIQGRLTELTWKTPEGVSYPFDTFDPGSLTDVWEVKTRHEWTSPLGMAAAPHHVRGGMHERIVGLEGQRLLGLYVSNRCGLRFRYAVDNCEAYQGLSQAWSGLPPVVYIPGPGERRDPC